MKNGLLIISLAASVTTALHAQSDASTSNPRFFGIPLGVSADSLRTLVPTLSAYRATKDTYSSIEVPLPNSSFRHYLFFVSPELGLCRIAAFSKNFNSDPYGTELQAAFTTLQEALTSEYGKPTRTADHLMDGSTWTDARDWMMSLSQKERRLEVLWVWEESQPYGNLGAVDIQAFGIDSTRGFVTLTYEIRNFAACIAAARKVDADAR